jgi:xanthine dehydrogenase accessory factor
VSEGHAHIDARISELTAARVPFVRATVVRAQTPTSAQPGDTAIVLGDGSIDGFVGGQCAETSLRVAASDVLSAGEALLLRVLPNADEAVFPDAPGARTVVNPCLSGGAVEIFLEPLLPAPLIAIVGSSPIAEAVASLAKSVSYAVERSTAIEVTPRTTAVVIATHGHDEEAWIRAALDADVGFIGVVASPKRGAAVLDGLQLKSDERARVHTPLGLWIGARSADEIALSIMAEIVKAVRLDGLRPSGSAPSPAAAGPRTAVDPICGMTVQPGPTSPTAEVAGEHYWFCCEGCRTRFLASA